jgi:hypothetical protein
MNPRGHGRKNQRIYAGAMESAGLGEAAHFLRKAKQQIVYAQFALENIDQTDSLESTSQRIGTLIKSIGEAMSEIETAELALIADAERKDMEETE